MCLAIPMKLVKIDGDRATADISGVKKEISVALLEDPKLGEYVIVHAGFAIERLSEEEAHETIRLLREISEMPENT